MADGADKTDELYPIAVLIDELKVRTFWELADGFIVEHGNLTCSIA
jgi:hypothetical protein